MPKPKLAGGGDRFADRGQERAVAIVVAADHVNWAAAALIGGPALVGGHVGASLGRQLPAPVLRSAIAVLGVVAIVVLETR